MTSPSSSNQIDAGIAPEALRSLRRGLERAHGFALFVAVIKTPVQCGALITLLREAAPKLHLHTVTLPADTTDILDEVLRQTAPDLRGPVMIVGLDAALPSAATGHPLLQALNLRRPEWPRLVQQPVVLWVPEYLYQLLARAVPDFLDWRSDTLHFPDLEPTQLQSLHSATWDGGLDNRMPVPARMERIRELESRVATNEASRDPVIRATVGDWLNELGLHLGLLGRSRKALACFEKELAITRELHDRRGEGAALGNLGLANAYLGDARKAIKFYEQALTIAREIRDQTGEANALGNLGVAHKNLGGVRRAIEFYNQHLVIACEMGDRRGEAADLTNLGNAYADLGDARKARELHEKALVIYRELGDRRGEGAVLGSLGLGYDSSGDARKAIGFFEQRLDIAREIGDRQGEGTALGSLGNAHRNLGNADKAIELFMQSLAIMREVGDRRGEGALLGNLGNIHFSLGGAHKAFQFYQRAMVIDREIGDRRGEGNALWNSALALDTLGRRAEAIARAEVALTIFEQIEAPHAAKVRAQLAKWRSAPVSGAET